MHLLEMLISLPNVLGLVLSDGSEGSLGFCLQNDHLMGTSVVH